MNDKFDFRVAEQLVQAVEMAAAQIDIKNEQMKFRFTRLHEYFKDEGYDQFSVDMNEAGKSIDEIIQQLHDIANYIANYKQQLQNEA